MIFKETEVTNRIRVPNWKDGVLVKIEVKIEVSWLWLTLLGWNLAANHISLLKFLQKQFLMVDWNMIGAAGSPKKNTIENIDVTSIIIV